MTPRMSMVCRLCFSIGIASMLVHGASVGQSALAQIPEAAGEQATSEAAEPLTLTLEDAVTMALQRNWDIQLADLALAEAEAAIGEAKAPDRFQLSLESSYSRLGPQTVAMPSDHAHKYGVALYKSLYSSGRNQTILTLARLNVDVKGLETVVARRQIALDAATAFYNVARAIGFFEVAGEKLTSAREHWRLASARYEAGAVPRFDVMRAEVEVANAEQQLIVAQAAVEIAKGVLKRLLAIEVTQPLQLVTTPHPSPIVVDPNLCIAMANQRREEIVVLDTHVRLAMASARLAKAERGLNLDLVGAYDRQSSTGFARDYAWNLTLSLSKSLSDGGASRSKEQQALWRAEQARALLGKVADDIELQVWHAYLNLEETRHRLSLAAKTVELAQEALRIAEVRYDAGLATPVEVTDARVALAAARTNQVDAIYGYQIAEAKLLSAINASEDDLELLAPRSETQ